MYKINDKISQSPLEMRTAYGDALINIANENKDLLVIDADCMSSVGTLEFSKKFPTQHINCGIMEANAIGVSAGLSVEGFIPFFSTFATFATRRAYDQIMLSCAYAQANVKIIGWDVGLAGGANGGTHMALEDIGIMRNVPNMVVLEASDPVMMKELTNYAYHHQGNVYIRGLRKKAQSIYSADSQFVIGKANKIHEGNDLTIITNGMMVEYALTAARELKNDGYSIRVLDMFTIKPIDKEAIIKAASETQGIITLENHSIINGLGSAVLEVVGEHCPVKVKRMGVNDTFGEVGDITYLLEKHNLTVENIKCNCIKMIGEK